MKRLIFSLLAFLVAGFLAAKTAPKIPTGLMDEAARLEAQWPQQMKALEESGQVLNMAKKADVKYIDYHKCPLIS